MLTPTGCYSRSLHYAVDFLRFPNVFFSAEPTRCNPRRSLRIVVQGPFGSILSTRKPLIIPKINKGETALKEYGMLFETPVVCAPLVLHEMHLDPAVVDATDWAMAAVAGNKKGIS